MAELMPSLLSLEEELTCSICLCTFENPVTLPCGHNFCQGCLDEAWKESFLLFCPQCRHHYSSKPELKKNTVISAVVDTFKKKSSSSLSVNSIDEPVNMKEPVNIKEPEVIKCDTCMEVKAFKTCLTCMASFCEEHIRPHQENPIFRSHQLTDPLGDLQERICQVHCKIVEFFCQNHDCSICSTCLQQMHRGCEYTSPQERQAQKESEMKQMLSLLDRKIDKNHVVMAQMKEQQFQLQDSAAARKKMMSAEYQVIRDLIDRDEQDSLKAVDKALESGQARLDSLCKKFGQNVKKMTTTKSEINSLLTRADTLAFLQASSSAVMPSQAEFEPYCPRMNVDSKTVVAYHSSAVAVKELLTKILNAPVENRIPLLRPGPPHGPHGPHGPNGPLLGPHGPQAPLMAFPGPDMAQGRNFPPRHHRSQSPGASLRPGHMRMGPVPPNQRPDQRPEHMKGKKAKGEKSERNREKDQGKKPPKPGPSDSCKGAPANNGAPNASIPRDISTAEKRSELLKLGTVLKMDPKTAHKRIALTEDFTVASVAEEPCPYPDGPERFSVCTQVLCSKGFAQGRHYWELKMNSNSFCSLGLAYGRLDRKGPTSRLGRNAESWCVEWFNTKLSAWHNSAETVLTNPNPGRVGVLLDCDGGSATFYNVADRAYPFHTFVFPFKGPVYPAFWMFSAGASISLCKLTA